MKIRCLLVDDEPPALKVLQNHISNISGLEIVGMCSNALEALNILHEKTVDLIFLDIKMPKLLGTEFLKNLSVPPKVVFVTAYREYAVESYNLDAVDYLVKPVSFDRFVKAISKVRMVMDQETVPAVVNYERNPSAFIYLKIDKGMQKIIVEEILYIESWKDYIKLYLSTGKSFLVKQSITSMENLLSTQNFLRVHRSYIISLTKLTGYTSNTVMISSQEIPIGRLYKHQVLQKIQ